MVLFSRESSDFLPGDRVQVFETDIGRIGMLTCFDVGWRDDWRVLKEKGADIKLPLSRLDHLGMYVVLVRDPGGAVVELCRNID